MATHLIPDSLRMGPRTKEVTDRSAKGLGPAYHRCQLVLLRTLGPRLITRAYSTGLSQMVARLPAFKTSPQSQSSFRSRGCDVRSRCIIKPAGVSYENVPVLSCHNSEVIALFSQLSLTQC